jgi:hypothetical protein
MAMTKLMVENEGIGSFFVRSMKYNIQN